MNIMQYLPTIIICAVLLLICVYAVFSYKKKLSNGCCGGGGELKIKPNDTNTKHYVHKMTVFIDGMTCSHCKMRVENTFNNIDGFYAKVSLKKKCADVWAMSAADEAQIKEIVEKAGYTYVKTVYEK